jgi:hypothetical protein
LLGLGVLRGELDYVLLMSRQMSVGYCKVTMASLRSLLRFLHVRGEIESDLATYVPAVATWRLAWLPRALESALDSAPAALLRFDSMTSTGKRYWPTIPHIRWVGRLHAVIRLSRVPATTRPINGAGT